MTDSEARAIKQKCLEELRGVVPRFVERLSAVDFRLRDYAIDIIREDIDIHNLYEVLGFRKFLRLLETYQFDTEFVQVRIRMFENLKLDSIYGFRTYEATPSQVFIFCCLFGFRHLVNTSCKEGSREMMDTETVVDGEICDLRNLITSFIAEIPRKYGKTCLAGFCHFEGIITGDRDYEGYCVANSEEQSKLVFKALSDMLMQVDGGKRFRFTATEISWKKGNIKAGSIKALTAGGKAKDGLKASRTTNDEFGAAQRVKDHCDMESLINVVEGSMGPRREHLSLHTSTAGIGIDTPYELLIRSVETDLVGEMDRPFGAYERDNDWQMCILLHPDQWELDDDILQTERVIKKCNPHLGVTIQPDFYQKEWAEAKVKGEGKRLEVVTKLYNVFQSGRVKEWIPADAIRKLQKGRSIDDLNSEDGWVCFIGMDFSKGDDLNAQSYLCYNRNTGEFFADMDAWISERTLASNSNSTLYQLWKEQGWLRVSPGATINENLPLDRIAEISEHLTIMQIGYDAYDAKRFVNAIAAWVYSQGIDPTRILRPVSQTYASYNSPVQEIQYMVMNDPPLIEFSQNPMWPWEFSNCYLDEDIRTGNQKIIKSGESKKVDNCQCLATATILYDAMDGSEQ